MNIEQHPASTTNYYKGRMGHKITEITIHSMVGTLNGTIGWFAKSRPENPTSAHYSIGSDGRVVQHVPEDCIAYHAGNGEVNARSIGIEHEDGGDAYSTRPDALYRRSSELVADICRRYGIPCNNQFIKPHRDVTSGSTACPGNLDIARIIAGARTVLDGATSYAFIPFNNLVGLIVETNIRTEPTLATNVRRVAAKGVEVAVEGYITNGETIDGNSTWWKLKDEPLFFHSSCGSYVPSSTPLPAWNKTIHKITPITKRLSYEIKAYNFVTGEEAIKLPTGTEVTVVGQTDVFQGSTWYMTEYSILHGRTIGVREEDFLIEDHETIKPQGSTGPVPENPGDVEPEPSLPATEATRLELEQQLAQYKNDAARLTDILKMRAADIDAQNTMIDSLQRQIVEKDRDLVLMQTIKKTNETLSLRVQDLETIVGDRTDREEDILVKHFASWRLIGLGKANPFTRLATAIRVAFLPLNHTYVVGWKKDGQLAKVESNNQA